MVNRLAGVGDAECYVLFAAVKLSPYDTSAFGIFDRIVKQYRHKLYYTVTVAAEPDAFFDVLFNHYAFEGGRLYKCTDGIFCRSAYIEFAHRELC